MRLCQRCGVSVEDGAYFCPQCGAPVYPPPQPQRPLGYCAPEPPDITLLLLWSVFNLMCCFPPLGIVGLILTLLVSGAETEEKAQKLVRWTSHLNLIGTVGGVLLLLLYIFLSVV